MEIYSRGPHQFQKNDIGYSIINSLYFWPLKKKKKEFTNLALCGAVTFNISIHGPSPNK